MSAPHTAPVPAPQATPNANSPRGEVVLVTGMSGGGKSIAMHALEDAGFFCVDNLPPELLPQFLDLERQRGWRRVAIAVDVRSAGSLPQLLGQQARPIARADLRYTNGFTLAWGAPAAPQVRSPTPRAPAGATQPRQASST